MQLSDQVFFFPVTFIWNSENVVSDKKLRDLSSDDLKDLLRTNKGIRFVVADVGLKPKWIPIRDCYKFWKEKVRPRVLEPDSGGFYLGDYLGHHCYAASEWESDNDFPIVLLEKFH
jgi:hypothetical protein